MVHGKGTDDVNECLFSCAHVEEYLALLNAHIHQSCVDSWPPSQWEGDSSYYVKAFEDEAKQRRGKVDG